MENYAQAHAQKNVHALGNVYTCRTVHRTVQRIRTLHAFTRACAHAHVHIHMCMHMYMSTWVQTCVFKALQNYGLLLSSHQLQLLVMWFCVHLYPDPACWPCLFLKFHCWLWLVTQSCFLPTVLVPSLLAWYWPGSDSTAGSWLCLIPACLLVSATKSPTCTHATLCPDILCHHSKGKQNKRYKGNPLINTASTRYVTVAQHSENS